MPYCAAVISEVLRISCVTLCGVPHRILSDMIFNGYHIRKEAIIFPNLYGVHHDPESWEDPESFRPEQDTGTFLNEDGTKFVQNEALMSFAEGKRKCIGESFARDTLFLFATSICQQFNIQRDPYNKESPDFEANLGILLEP